jgi:hypothetical protein
MCCAIHGGLLVDARADSGRRKAVKGVRDHRGFSQICDDMLGAVFESQSRQQAKVEARGCKDGAHVALSDTDLLTRYLVAVHRPTFPIFHHGQDLVFIVCQTRMVAPYS